MKSKTRFRTVRYTKRFFNRELNELEETIYCIDSKGDVLITVEKHSNYMGDIGKREKTLVSKTIKKIDLSKVDRFVDNVFKIAYHAKEIPSFEGREPGELHITFQDNCISLRVNGAVNNGKLFIYMLFNKLIEEAEEVLLN